MNKQLLADLNSALKVQTTDYQLKPIISRDVKGTEWNYLALVNTLHSCVGALVIITINKDYANLQRFDTLDIFDTDIVKTIQAINSVIKG